MPELRLFFLELCINNILQENSITETIKEELYSDNSHASSQFKRTSPKVKMQPRRQYALPK